MEQLQGTMIHYPWGTFEAIHSLLGTQPDGRPLAEFWLGAHPLAPSALDGTTLDAAIAQHPTLLGDQSLAAFGPHLPFLMKVPSARHALSLQAHPNREQAQAGFAAEEAAVIPRDSPQRTYKDTWPKPEILWSPWTSSTRWPGSVSPQRRRGCSANSQQAPTSNASSRRCTRAGRGRLARGLPPSAVPG